MSFGSFATSFGRGVAGFKEGVSIRDTDIRENVIEFKEVAKSNGCCWENAKVEK